LRLGFDATSLTAEGKGLARFQREFLRTAAELGEPEELVVFVPERPDEGALPAVAGWTYVHVETRPMLRWEQVGLPRAARAVRLDVVLTLSERAALWGPPRVVYVFEHPWHRARRNREVGVGARQRTVDLVTLGLFALSQRRAAAVLAASESTRRDLGRGTVVYPGVGPEFRPGERARRYLLHISSHDPRDNTETALAAYERSGLEVPLVVGGSRRVDGRGVEFVGYRTGEALVELYRGAIAYVDPSLYEGFGLQALEALACGTPAIASNVTSLPEVVGDAGVLLDPVDVDGFADAMRRLVQDPELCAELGRKAIEQAARFKWEWTVQECLAACTASARQSRDVTGRSEVAR
jgi:glycosyltransferase involved in cell wall biosynthesis